ncbi:MAG: DUF4130 domain-containing protein [Promethearchaeota archaeon]|jgi:hypothetical protein
MTKSGSKKDPLEVVGCAKGYSHEELFKNLPRHCKSTPALMQQIRKIPEVVLRNSGTLMAKKVNKMMREVNTEAYRAIQFTRTEINNRGVLFGVVLLKHKVIAKVLKYFHERFPGAIICLYNENTHKTTTIDENGKFCVYNSPLNEVVKKVSENRPIIPYFEDINFTGEEIFKTLYASQNIIERENPRYFGSMIPQKCFDLPGMRNGIEKSYIEKRNSAKNKTIDEYF